MKLLFIPLLMLGLLDVPKWEQGFPQGNHISLKWSHPDCYLFEIEQSNGSIKGTNTVFFRSNQVRKVHDFKWNTRSMGKTNIFRIRAVNESNLDQKSNWSQTFTVIE